MRAITKEQEINMSMTENSLFSIVNDITTKIDGRGTAFSLRQRDYKDPQLVVYDARGNGDGNNSCTITGDHQNRVTDYTSIVVKESIMENVVRRLTPLECERLQGYPDGWTDIGEWTDTKGKIHKYADSPRYKALGNSIALPFWEWMAERMTNILREDGIDQPTMASLFDGIGGFPLVYSRNGVTPVWASEIEEFPIAVTKKRFPEKEEKTCSDVHTEK